MRIAERDSLILEVVLIETLWNVNESNGTWHKSPKVGINRNIVECKYR